MYTCGPTCLPILHIKMKNNWREGKKTQTPAKANKPWWLGASQLPGGLALTPTMCCSPASLTAFLYHRLSFLIHDKEGAISASGVCGKI